jgi:5S rRNA maturation endonuclease (ribonuclease M5)
MSLNFKAAFIKFGLFLLSIQSEGKCSQSSHFLGMFRPSIVKNQLITACGIRSFHTPPTPFTPMSFPKFPQTMQEWTPIFPVPREQQYVDLMKEWQLSYMLRERTEIARYPYLRSDGKLLGYVVRLEDQHSNKITPMFTYCQNEVGKKQWRFKGFGDNRPLYGLDILKNKPHAPVLIVEGEKTCDAARLIFTKHAVITWSGGANSVHKSKWSVLKGRKVVIWPDNDVSGQNAALTLINILKNKAASLSQVNLSPQLPHKWDLADPLPEGLVYDELIKNRILLSRPSKG